jgi:hypothetical protein
MTVKGAKLGFGRRTGGREFGAKPGTKSFRGTVIVVAQMAPAVGLGGVFWHFCAPHA